jgi:hypothetical protein
MSIVTARPLAFLAAVRDCLARLTHPSVTAADYLKIMRRLGLAETATFLDEHLAQWQP